jgi:hypothetical protein
MWLSLDERIKKLKDYPWSSLQGFNVNRKLSYIDYRMVLGEYGGAPIIRNMHSEAFSMNYFY